MPITPFIPYSSIQSEFPSDIGEIWTDKIAPNYEIIFERFENGLYWFNDCFGRVGISATDLLRKYERKGEVKTDGWESQRALAKKYGFVWKDS